MNAIEKLSIHEHNEEITFRRLMTIWELIILAFDSIF